MSRMWDYSLSHRIPTYSFVTQRPKDISPIQEALDDDSTEEYSSEDESTDEKDYFEHIETGKCSQITPPVEGDWESYQLDNCYTAPQAGEDDVQQAEINRLFNYYESSSNDSDWDSLAEEFERGSELCSPKREDKDLDPDGSDTFVDDSVPLSTGTPAWGWGNECGWKEQEFECDVDFGLVDVVNS